ncbi:zinc finger SWIM domain-containing protein 7 isoform X6 [Pseudophryne corroboree]|uniref:zinc finger SWIM domain-containing protein 7 isoform X6 n=1 Tax=Pseudophryne corroboree TaxID=495146 RepID=UPI00308138B8
MEAVLPSVAEELLREIKRCYQETSEISDEHLLGLQEALVKCTPVIRPATTAPVLPSLSLCSDGMKVWWCAKKTLLCKHILAVYLSQAMGTCQELMVSDKQMIEILLAKED